MPELDCLNQPSDWIDVNLWCQSGYLANHKNEHVVTCYWYITFEY